MKESPGMTTVSSKQDGGFRKQVSRKLREDVEKNETDTGKLGDKNKIITQKTRLMIKDRSTPHTHFWMNVTVSQK